MTAEYLLPKLALWFARLGTSPTVQRHMRSNPILFAHWYAQIGIHVSFPEEVQRIQDSQRAKKMTLDRMLTLLNKLHVTLKDASNVGYARTILEGVEVHDWVVHNLVEFNTIMQQEVAGITDNVAYVEAHPDQYATKLTELITALALSPVEADLLSLAVACTLSWEIQHLLSVLVNAKAERSSPIFSDMLGYSVGDIAVALGAKGILRTAGLLQVDRREGTPKVSEIWLKLLLTGPDKLFDCVLEPLQVKHGSGMPAQLLMEDMILGTTILNKAKEAGINLLLYGAEGLEKRGVLQEMIRSAGKVPYTLIPAPEAISEMPVIAFVAQRLLHLNHEDAVLVIDHPLDVLERKPNDFLRQILGIEVDSAHIQPFDEMLLQDNPVPTVWVGVPATSLPEETISRFVFHAKLQKARKEERRAQMMQLLVDLELSEKTTEEILKLADVSALQIQTARKAATLAAGTRNHADREAALVQAIKRSLAALQRNTVSKEKECVTAYSLDYLNCSGKFGPAKVLKALALRPKGSICLYGPPGTGKTQFVEYLASTLETPLIARRASDLLSKYVGDNEKNIATMFAEAEAEEAILFLDEGDSFLRDRSVAVQEWEVTKVNELLQQMERFPGIFIVATNLFKGLDPAALRRFTFKLEFQAMAPSQRLRMFLTETGIIAAGTIVDPAQLEAWNMKLTMMPMLTAGDFATVKRQTVLLGETLTPEDWINQLQIECATKAK